MKLVNRSDSGPRLTVQMSDLPILVEVVGVRGVQLYQLTPAGKGKTGASLQRASQIVQKLVRS